MAVRKKPIAKWRHIADFTSRGILTFRRVFNSGVMDDTERLSTYSGPTDALARVWNFCTSTLAKSLNPSWPPRRLT
jgi:hypothetical protein